MSKPRSKRACTHRQPTKLTNSKTLSQARISHPEADACFRLLSDTVQFSKKKTILIEFEKFHQVQTLQIPPKTATHTSGNINSTTGEGEKQNMHFIFF